MAWNAWTAIVVDDGSNDGTVDLVKRADMPGLELLTVPRGGKAAALNAGLARARGEIVHLLHGDDFVDLAAGRSRASQRIHLGWPECGALHRHEHTLWRIRHEYADTHRALREL